jgi:hypothetical protein
LKNCLPGDVFELYVDVECSPKLLHEEGFKWLAKNIAQSLYEWLHCETGTAAKQLVIEVNGADRKGQIMLKGRHRDVSSTDYARGLINVAS